MHVRCILHFPLYTVVNKYEFFFLLPARTTHAHAVIETILVYNIGTPVSNFVVCKCKCSLNISTILCAHEYDYYLHIYIFHERYEREKRSFLSSSFGLVVFMSDDWWRNKYISIDPSDLFDFEAQFTVNNSMTYRRRVTNADPPRSVTKTEQPGIHFPSEFYTASIGYQWQF